MNEYLQKIIVDFELHSTEGIRECFAHGVKPNDFVDGEPLIYSLVNMYTRSKRFKECVQFFIDHGLVMEDQVLLAILSDNAVLLDGLLKNNPEARLKKYSFRCTYTPLFEASLLHICAEYNHVDCARVLLKYGADINAKAGVDEFGFGGQTPVFHTVNQNNNQSAGMMHFLLSQSADLLITVPGLIWGKGYEWETFIPAVNPVSYAMMGLLPQVHRDQLTIANVVSILCRHAYGIDYTPANVPNAYLKH